jgi:ferredoxin
VPHCPHEALHIQAGRVWWQEHECQQCDTCLHLCPQQATPMAQRYSVMEIVEQVRKVTDSVVTSGAYSDLGTSGFYGQSAKPSDYGNAGATSFDDAALIVAAGAADNAMQTVASFDHSTLTGDVLFASTFDNNFYVNGDPATDTTADGVYNPTTNGWDGTDKLELTLTNGSKWVGAAQSSYDEKRQAKMRAALA